MNPDWSEVGPRMALLALVQGQALREAGWSRGVLRWLEERRWVVQEGRSRTWQQAPGHEDDLRALLDHSWAEWPAAEAALRHAGLPAAPEGWQRLMDAARRDRISRGSLPRVLARRTAAAALRGDSKSQSELESDPVFSSLRLDDAGVVRLRPHRGLRLELAGRTIDADAVAPVAGEVVVAERSLAKGLRLCGTAPRAVLTVENPAAYVDLPEVEGLLVALLPGADQRAGFSLLAQLEGVPWAHFGDLDPAGLDLYRRCSARRADCVWLVPDWWAELLDTHGRSGASWPERLGEVPPLVARLANRGWWLEQEPLVLDPRLGELLRAWVAKGRL